MAWICIHTKPAQELPVQGGLLDLALETFLPTRRVTVPDRKRPGHSCHQTVPLFPRYLFADCDPGDFFAVPSVRGVHSVVQTRTEEGYPQFLTIPDRAVTALKRGPVPPLKVGQSLRLKAPYCGLLAIVSSIANLDSSGQVEAWLHMLGGTRAVTFHHSLITAESL